MTQRKRTFLILLVTASAFLVISLLDRQMWPHRFALGIPFVLAAVCVAVGVIELNGGELKRRLCSGVSTPSTAPMWFGCATLAWNLTTLFIESSYNRTGIFLLSTVMCLLTGFALTVSGYQWLSNGPVFQPHEPEDSRNHAALTSKWSRANAVGLIACVMAVSAILQLAIALPRIAASQRRDWDAQFFISDLGQGPRGDEFTMAMSWFGLMMFAFFLNFLAHHQQFPSASIRMAFFGSMAVAGIIGVGLWDLRSPVHYVAVAVWGIAAIVAASSSVPTSQGLRSLFVCKWLARLAFLTYGSLMIGLLWIPEFRAPCIVAQRIAVGVLLLWFGRVWFIVFAGSLPQRAQ